MLAGICRALASHASLDELGPALLRWTREAVGDVPAQVRILLSGPGGRLRTLAAEGQGERVPSHQTCMVPMVSRGETFGLIEVIGPAAAVERSRPLLEAIASQGAISLRSIREQSGLRRRARALNAYAALSRVLVAARAPRSAVRAATEFCSSHLEMPVAGWLVLEGSSRLELVAARGMGAHERRVIKGGSWILPPRGVDGPDLPGLAEHFRKVLGTPHVVMVRAADAVVMAGAASSSLAEDAGELLNALAPLLDEILKHLAAVARAELRNQQLDLGIAWTAHELRGPLLGLRTFMEAQERRGSAGLLRRAEASRELEELVQQLEGLLQWAAGVRPLRLRPTDLMRLVRQAVRQCTGPAEPARVSISGPRSARVLAEAGELRRAIANLVRNALVYSPPEEAVDVSVEQRNGSFVVSVRDRGPGVPPEETGSIFDPFIRGRAGRRHRAGRGLGLFIARRVIEAHGGAIWVEPGRWGATFCLQVPR